MSRENWQRALTEVEEGVRACLAALDRYEAAFAGVLAPTASSTPADGPGAWEASLAKADEQANRVERLLIEQESAWGRWHAALARWEQSLQQPR